MSEMPSLPVVSFPVADLIPYEKNAKKHPPEQVKKLAASIKRLGFTPLQVEPDGTIITGHGRRLAAIELGLKKVPVIIRTDLTKLEADALRIADNRAASTEYDYELLMAEGRRIAVEDLELAMPSFNEKELEFAASDLGEFNDDVFVDDVSSAVEAQKEENKEKEAEADASAAPLGDAFGFKRVSIEQSRTIRQLMSQVQAITGKAGPDALIEALKAATDHLNG